MRRQLIDKFGENDEDGPYSVYAGGLWVRTSLDPQMQDDAADRRCATACCAMTAGAAGAGRSRHVEIDGDDWRPALLDTNIGARL